MSADRPCSDADSLSESTDCPSLSLAWLALEWRCSWPPDAREDCPWPVPECVELSADCACRAPCPPCLSLLLDAECPWVASACLCLEVCPCCCPACLELSAVCPRGGACCSRARDRDLPWVRAACLAECSAWPSLSLA